MGNTLPPQYIRLVAESVGADTDSGEALSDNDLMVAIAEGDRAAFAVLMKRYLARMVTLAHRIVFDREQAREIAQEAFLRVWRQAENWDPYGSATFLTWLHRVVVNLSISCRRRAREQVSIDVIEDMPSGLADGFDHIAASDKKHIVREALEKLPERQRAAIALYYFDDLPQVQAAEVMEMTPRAFDSLIVRARVNLKKSLADFGFRRREDLS
jgi:RNA polymerase sigma-70 factor (ECF subfamily)